MSEHERMTRAEAVERARERWGVNGWARRYRNGAFIHSRTSRDHRVGVRRNGFVVYGAGSSFEAAFADADAREARNG